MANLAHYLALRHHDIRPLQCRLMWRGLSSLGRLESRVLPTVDAVLAAFAAITNRQSHSLAPTAVAFVSGEAELAQASDAHFGPPQARRRTRIMVTQPSEAAGDPRSSSTLRVVA